MSVKAVLSDLGGVLIDYSFGLAIAEWARVAGVDANVLAGRVVVDETWHQFEVGGLNEREFWSHFRQQCGLSLTDDELVNGWNSVFIGVNAEVERLLQEVADRGVRVVAVTNTNVAHDRAWRARFAGSLEFLAAVYTSWETGARKPDPAFFHRVLESEHLAPHEAVFIDDLALNVQAAETLGMDAIPYTSVGALRDALASRGLVAVGQA